MDKTCYSCEKSYWSDYWGYVCGLHDRNVDAEDHCEEWSSDKLPWIRTFNVGLMQKNGSYTETQFDINNGDFAEMFNELISLVYDLMKEDTDLNGAEITGIEEALYDGNE